MRATFLGGLAALAAMGLCGCTEPGAQSVTEPSRAPEVQVVIDLVNRDAGPQLAEGIGQYEKGYCEVHLRRNNGTDDVRKCEEIRDRLGRVAQGLEQDLKRLQPVPAELDEIVRDTTTSMAAVRISAKPGKSSEQLTLALVMAAEALRQWSAYSG